MKKESPSNCLLLFIDGHYEVNGSILTGAVNGDRTHDPQLGKLMLYHLSYYRKVYKH